MKSQITRFAFAGKCGRESASRCDSATLESPAAVLRSTRRRVGLEKTAGMPDQTINMQSP